MGQRIKRFDFVSRDSPQVGFESRVMGDYPARFGEHFLSALVNGSPSIKQERSGYSHGGVTIDSIYYYGKLVYQDVNLRSYFGSIRPPARLTFGFRLGRCILIHFPKRTFIHFFLPRRPQRLKRRAKSRPGKKKGRWWAFGKVGPIGCLHSSDNTEEERNEVRGRRAGKRVESIRLDDREKQNEIRIWPKKKQRYGYHDRSPSIKKNLSKSLRVSGAFKHPKAGVVNDIAFLIENDDSFRKTKFFKFFFPKKSRSDGPTSHLFKRTLPAVRPSLNYSVMQYLLNRKNQIHFDPVVVLNHFVAPGVAEPSTMGGANAQGRSLFKRIRSRIAFFVESSTSDKKSLAEAKKRLTHFIRLANDLRFAGTTKTTISLFPFFGATFLFPRDRVGIYNNLFFEDAREPLLGQLRIKCWNLMGKDKVMELIEKFIDLGRIGEWIKGIEMMIEIILRNRRIPYGYNSYLNEVKKMRSLLSNRTNTNTLIESVKIKSVYQSASPIAQDISFQLRKKTRSFRSIFRRKVKDIQLVMKKGVSGIRICCSGRSSGAEIARTECGKYGKTSRNVFNQKIDYASAEVSTRYGISGRCSRGCKPDGTKLGFGRYGTQSCRAGRLSYRAIEAARRAIIGHFHRAMSGQFRKNGKIWVRVFADIPITGKPTEVRMGRGKGNPTSWIARVSTGQVLFEMDGVSLSNARQAATLAAHKPCSSTKFVQWS
ncbi:small ribosomal subunit protein uS3m-like [Gastrolobium bilobum]|uniref:small ribosomal subunit protein uS3m-like n=1 Tax=Gastrolobium bilobum TaxID=150636 RepID=UPI002AAF6988|nr:small ribosomal subunit protein uS3m-like [Gastrolobium bilobum]